MYRPIKPVDWCQCCQQGVSLSNLEGSSDLLGDNNSPQIVHSSDNSCCGARHLRRLSKAFLICRPRPLAQVAPPATGGAPIAPQLLSFCLSPFCICRGRRPRRPAKTFPSSHDGLSWAPAPTIILQITLLVSVKERRLYCKIYFFKLP